MSVWEEVSLYVEANSGASKTKIRENVPGNVEEIDAALDDLIRDGEVERVDAGIGRGTFHYSKTPFRDAEPECASYLLAALNACTDRQARYAVHELLFAMSLGDQPNRTRRPVTDVGEVLLYLAELLDDFRVAEAEGGDGRLHAEVLTHRLRLVPDKPPTYPRAHSWQVPS